MVRRNFSVYRLAINPTKTKKSRNCSLQYSSKYKKVKRERPLDRQSRVTGETLNYDSLNKHIERIQNRITKRVF